MATNKVTRKIVLKGVRASYPHLFTPDTMSGKYTCDFIIRKDDPQVNAIREAAAAVYADCQAANKGKAIAAFELRDGDNEKPLEEAFKNSYYLKAKTSNASIKKSVFRKSEDGRSLITIDDESEFYGGCYCQASIVISWYEFNGKYGVHALLNGVCKEEGGEPFGHNGCDAADFLDNEDEGF